MELLRSQEARLFEELTERGFAPKEFDLTKRGSAGTAGYPTLVGLFRYGRIKPDPYRTAVEKLSLATEHRPTHPIA